MLPGQVGCSRGFSIRLIGNEAVAEEGRRWAACTVSCGSSSLLEFAAIDQGDMSCHLLEWNLISDAIRREATQTTDTGVSFCPSKPAAAESSNGLPRPNRISSPSSEVRFLYALRPPMTLPYRLSSSRDCAGSLKSRVWQYVKIWRTQNDIMSSYSAPALWDRIYRVVSNIPGTE